MYFKITNANENHNQYQYVDGLNVINDNTFPEGSHSEKGFYFTNEKYIFHFLDHGIYLREVTVPINAKCRLIHNSDSSKWVSNKIILGKKYLLSDIKTFEYLIECGSDIHDYNDMALRWASKHGYYDIVDLLIRNGANIHALNDSALRSASINGHIDIVQLLINKGANLHANQDEALRRACRNGYISVVKILIENGADVRAKCDSAFRWASLNSHKDIVQLLSQNGANH